MNVVEETITSRDFDFIGINTRIEEFGRAFLMDQKTIIGAQTILEELCVQKLLPCFDENVDMRVTLEYSEKTTHAQMRVFYNCDFDFDENSDDLSSVLIRRVAFEIERFHPEEGGYSSCIEIKLK